LRKLERAFIWLRKGLLLSPASDEVLVLPAAVQLVVPLFGTERYVEATDVQVLGGLAATQLFSAVTPDNFVDAVLAAGLEHNDAVARSITISLLAKTTSITSALNNTLRAAPANERVAALRPFFIPPGGSIAGEARDGVMGAGARMTLNYCMIRIPLGESPLLG